MKNLLLACTFLFCCSTALLWASEPVFVPVKIDGPIHDPPNHSYWYGPFSECASVADFDGDGDLDIAAGRNWYEAPDWIKHTDFRDGARTNGPETDDNSEFAMDVNFDGRPDIVSSGWMYMKGAFWYENPGDRNAKWKGQRIHAARSMEGVIHGDIDGDGDDDILCNHWNLVPGQAMTWLEHIDKAPWFVEHRLGTDGEKHGNGLGDIDGDGRTDIVTPVGWWQAPEQPTKDRWTFHPDYQFQSAGRYTSASHPMLVHDVNNDGLNDLIVGAAHVYGLSTLIQSVDDQGKRRFRQVDVETDYGQFHTMALGDLDGDGKDDLVTGKRLFAHHGRDTSCYEPLFAFWYNIQDGQFKRHILAFNHLPKLEDDKTSRNPAPNFVPAVGMKVNIADIDADGNNDIVVSGKGGLYVFYRRGSSPQPRPKHRLPHEDNYPSWTDWTKTN